MSPLATTSARARSAAHRTLRLKRGPDYMSGPDVLAFQKALNQQMAAYAGLHDGDDQLDVDGRYGPATRAAYRWVGWYVGGFLGETLKRGATVTAQRLIRDPSHLTPAQLRRAENRRKNPIKDAPAAPGWPLAARGRIIGLPGQGTHSWHVAPNNWQSDNAIDIGVPKRTKVFAVADGRIGSPIGHLNTSNPAMLGIRLYLETDGNSWYYAHLDSLADGIAIGTPVRRGRLLGYSGVANGSPHLHIACKNGTPRSLLAT